MNLPFASQQQIYCISEWSSGTSIYPNEKENWRDMGHSRAPWCWFWDRACRKAIRWTGCSFSKLRGPSTGNVCCQLEAFKKTSPASSSWWLSEETAFVEKPRDLSAHIQYQEFVKESMSLPSGSFLISHHCQSRSGTLMWVSTMSMELER